VTDAGENDASATRVPDIRILDDSDFSRVLRRHWSQKFGDDFSPTYLRGDIAAVAMLLGAHVVTIRTDGEWWTVIGDADWLKNVRDDPVTVFNGIEPIPGMVNSMRPETFLREFADRIAISTGRDIVAVRGAVDDCPLAEIVADSQWVRGVSFTAK
jgi:hypothetical protein